MKTEYKREMNHNYLVFHEDTELDTSSYQVRMLLGNVIPLLLKCQFHGVNGKTVFHYDITSKQSLAILYERKLLKETDLRLIFGSYVQVMELMEEYLLKPEQILFQPEYMYMDVNKKEIYYCYLPGKEGEAKEQFRVLVEYILPKIDHEDENAVLLGYGIYRWVLEDEFHLDNIKAELFRSGGKKEENIKKNNKAENPELMSEISARVEESEYKEEKYEELFKDDLEQIDRKKQNPQNAREVNTKSTNKEKSGKKKTAILQNIYIIVPVAGTIIIMAILAANMTGLLPWLEVERLLMSVVLVSMVISVVCFLIGKVQERKKREENNYEWKEKVRKYNEAEEENYQEEEIVVKTDKGDSVIQENKYDETIVLSASVKRGPATLVSREPGELATIYLKEDLTVIGKLETAADIVIAMPTISRLHAKIRKKEEEYYLADLNSRNGTSVNGRMLKVNEEYLLQDEDEVDFAEARYIFLK